MEVIKNNGKVEGGLFDYGNVLQKFDNWAFISKIAENKEQGNKEKIYKVIFESRLYQVIDIDLISLKTFYNLVTEQSGINRKKITEKIFFDAFAGRFSGEIKENIDFLKKLKKEKYRLGLISNTNKADYEKVIKNSSAIKHFDAVALSYEAGIRKPDEDFFFYAAEKLGLPPKKLFFVDDNKQYVDTALKIGFKVAVQYTSGLDLEKILKESLK